METYLWQTNFTPQFPPLSPPRMLLKRGKACGRKRMVWAYASVRRPSLPWLRLSSLAAPRCSSNGRSKHKSRPAIGKASSAPCTTCGSAWSTTSTQILFAATYSDEFKPYRDRRHKVRNPVDRPYVHADVADGYPGLASPDAVAYIERYIRCRRTSSLRRTRRRRVRDIARGQKSPEDLQRIARRGRRVSDGVAAGRRSLWTSGISRERCCVIGRRIIMRCLPAVPGGRSVDAAKASLRQVVLPHVTSAAGWDAPRAVHAEHRFHLAWVARARRSARRSWPASPRRFASGMAARKDILGDKGASDPAALGTAPLGSTDAVHIGVIISSSVGGGVAPNRSVLRGPCRGWPASTSWRSGCHPRGASISAFRDGIGGPHLIGSGFERKCPGRTDIMPGEFIFGYPDESGADSATARSGCV